MKFTIRHRDGGSRARNGEITTARGRVRTPVFCPVATRGSVRCLSSEELAGIGFEMLLANAWHLSLRPGAELVEKAGGLHRFMSWDRLLLTDSGGYQVFSLEDARVDDAGAVFRSVYDGRRHRLTPAGAIAAQAALGADIIMPLDQPVPWPAARAQAEEALRRTTLWAVESLRTPAKDGQSLFGIVQGSSWRDLRRRSAGEVSALDFPGYALGGFCLGEPREEMNELVAYTAGLLPEGKPRYLMGVGSPPELLAAIGAGIDIFDCVLPTHIARNGTALTSRGRVIVRDAASRDDFSPLDPACGCFVCRNYSRAYLRHLLNVRELTVLSLLSFHNLFFMQSLVRQAAGAIEKGDYASFLKSFRRKWYNNV